MLDNTVAGGIPSGIGIYESMEKECMEEASLDATLVKKYARAVGAVSYFFRCVRTIFRRLQANSCVRTSQGWLQPEIEYVYGIAIPPHIDGSIFEPKPLDGEVESFEVGLVFITPSQANNAIQFMNQDKVTEKLRAGLFKPNCGLGKWFTPSTKPELNQAQCLLTFFCVWGT